MAKIGTHMCLLEGQHGPHDWWYTSSGGGHMLREEFKDDPLERDVKQWHCPGNIVEVDEVSLTPEEAVDHIYNSLDAAHETVWAEESGDTWVIYHSGDTIGIEVTDVDGNVISNANFKLVPTES